MHAALTLGGKTARNLAHLNEGSQIASLTARPTKILAYKTPTACAARRKSRRRPRLSGASSEMALVN